MNSKTVVVVQVRLSSNRLPGKTLLSIQGLPAIVLLCERLRSEKYDLVLATPDNEEGEILEQTVRIHCTNPPKFATGDLNNLLSRFVEALLHYDDDVTVVRLTGDNILIDASFIEELLEQYHGQIGEVYGQAIINQQAYGINAEIFKKQHLLEALKCTNDPYDLEHVTPFIRRSNSCYPLAVDYEVTRNVRVTLDNFSDFLFIQKVFSKFSDPISVSWKDLLNEAQCLTSVPQKLMLGTAQFGFDYGLTNTHGKVSSAEINDILQFAQEQGCTALDTAAVYGASENELGKLSGYLKNHSIVTKIAPNATSYSATEASLRRSLMTLGRQSVSGALLHSFEGYQQESWNALKQCKAEGLTEKIGVSVYEPEEALSALDDEDVQLIQIPINIMDWRWAEFLAARKNRLDVDVHARSVFLQGLLLNDKLLHEKT